MTEAMPGIADLDALADRADLRMPAGPRNGSDPPANQMVAEKPVILLSGTQLDATIDAAVHAIQRRNNPPDLFLRAGRVVHVRRDENDRPLIDQIGEVELLERLAAAAEWKRRTHEGDVLHSQPTRGLAGVTLARIRALEGALPGLVSVVESPLLLSDGTLIQAAGYEPRTRSYYVPEPGFGLGPVREDPTAEDVEASVAGIEEVFGDFPFGSDSDRATAWAMLLSTTLRTLIDGCVPLFLVDAPTQGTGKGLLATVMAIISTGRAGGMMPAPGDRDDAEWRKRITSVFQAGHAIGIIDNVEQPIASPSLAAALTAMTWQDRALGRSELVSFPARAVWIATGNNLRLRGDLARRSVWCRMDAKAPRPWQREGFKHADLVGWTTEFRGEILAAVFTVARAWIRAGRPAPPASVPAMGSFEAWRHVIGGMLAVAKVPGFLGNLGELYDSADDETPAWTGFLAAWWTLWKDEAITAKEVVEAVVSDSPEHRAPTLVEALPDVLEHGGKRPLTAQRLGKALSRKKDQRFVIDDEGTTVALVEGAHDGHSKRNRWRLKCCG